MSQNSQCMEVALYFPEQEATHEQGVIAKDITAYPVHLMALIGHYQGFKNGVNPMLYPVAVLGLVGPEAEILAWPLFEICLITNRVFQIFLRLNCYAPRLCSAFFYTLPNWKSLLIGHLLWPIATW